MLKLRGKVYHSKIKINGKGVWKTTKTGDLNQAKHFESKRIKNRNQQKSAGRMPWADHCKQYMAEYSATSKVKESMDRDRYAIQHFNRHVKVTYLDQIKPSHGETYKTKRKADTYIKKDKKIPIAESTINRELNSLKSILERAVEWEHLDANPWKSVQKFEEHESSPDPWTEEEGDALLAACWDKFEVLMELLGIDAGLRRSEKANLKWTDFNFETDIIRMVSSMTRRTKTKRIRVVAMTPRLKQAALEHKAESNGEWVFMSCGEQATRGYLRTIHNRVRGRANVEGGHHRGRHTYLSDLANGGVPLNVVQKAAGHARITTTQRYLHSDEAILKEATKRLPGYQKWVAK